MDNLARSRNPIPLHQPEHVLFPWIAHKLKTKEGEEGSACSRRARRLNPFPPVGWQRAILKITATRVCRAGGWLLVTPHWVFLLPPSLSLYRSPPPQGRLLLNLHHYQRGSHFIREREREAGTALPTRAFRILGCVWLCGWETVGVSECWWQ